MEHLKAEAGIDLTHVAYRGGAQATSAISTGEVDVFWIAASVALPFIEAGQVHALAVGERQRTKILPDVPTVAEQGFPDYAYTGWFGLFTATGTPVPTLDLLRKEFAAALALPDVIERLAVQGMVPHPTTQAEALAMMNEDNRLLGPLIKRIGLDKP
jgi:tripartite-type tricarboxylate transporter receptor subunit TctC